MTHSGPLCGAAREAVQPARRCGTIRGARLLRLAGSFVVPLGGGLLVGASLPPGNRWPLGPVGIAALAIASSGRSWRRRAANGMLAGVGQVGLGCAWALQFTGAGYVVLVLVESCFFALASMLSPRGRGRVPALAGLLTCAEWARDSWPFGGLPLGGIALGQLGGPLAAIARLGGPLAVAGAAYLAGTGLAALAGAAMRRDRRGLAAGTAAVVVVTALAVAAAHAPAGGPPGRRVVVAAVQGGGRRGLSALVVPAASVLSAQLAATTGVGRGAALVVWPEDSVSLAGALDTSAVRPVLAGLARADHATFVVGVTEPAGPGRFRNEAVVFDPSGRIVATYEKRHPVPFGEYVPFRSVLRHLVSLAAVPRDMVRGRRVGMVATPVGRIALLVSFETFFTGLGRAAVRAGGELIVVPTNTASYASAQVPAQELAASRLEAVSEGRDLVQAASTGISAVVDARGTVLGQTALGTRAVLRETVRLHAGLTLYDDLGEWPVLLLALAGAAAGAVLATTTARARSSRRHGAGLSSRPDRRGRSAG